MLIFSPHKLIKKLLSEEDKVPRTLFEARKVAGSAKCKQSKTVGICAVLYIKFVYSVKSLMKSKSLFI